LLAHGLWPESKRSECLEFIEGL